MAVMTEAEHRLMRWLDLMEIGYSFHNDGRIYPPKGGSFAYIPADVCRQLIDLGYVHSLTRFIWVISLGGIEALRRWEAHKQWLIEIQAD
jgi:hypothetical protein